LRKLKNKSESTKKRRATMLEDYYDRILL